nr:MAG TPA: hypothetical protein [Caudoviricetes sp.]
MSLQQVQTINKRVLVEGHGQSVPFLLNARRRGSMGWR